MMSTVCVGRCGQYAAKGVKLAGGGSAGRYALGQKRCGKCERFIRWDGVWCPCCGGRLRGTPKNGRQAFRRQRRDGLYGMCHTCHASGVRLHIINDRGVCERCQR